MFLPLSNCSVIKVVRPGLESGNYDYDDYDEPDTEIPAPDEDSTLFEGLADGIINSKIMRMAVGGRVDELLVTELYIPAVVVLERGDEVTVRRRGRADQTLKLVNVIDDTSDVHPVPVYRCTTEVG